MLLVDITDMLPEESKLLLRMNLPAALPEKFSIKRMNRVKSYKKLMELRDVLSLPEFY